MWKYRNVEAQKCGSTEMWKRRNVEVQKCGSAENPEYSKVRITAGTGVNMKEKILNILQGADDYISGQYLCEMLGVSPADISA